VGIGVTTPTRALHINNGNAQIVRDDGSDILFTLDGQNQGITWTIGNDDSADGNFVISRSADLNSDALVIDTNNRVGIGVTTPTSTLTILQDAATTPGITVQASAGSPPNANLFQLTGSTGSFLTGFTAAGGLLMRIASTSALNIQDDNGNSTFSIDTTSQLVGINDSSPDGVLDVQDSAGNTLFVVTDGGTVGNATTTGYLIVGTANPSGYDLGTGDLLVGADATITTALTLAALTSCTALETDSNGLVLCGTDAGGNTAWDDIGNPDADDEIDFGSFQIELNVSDFRIGDGGTNFWQFDGSGNASTTADLGVAGHFNVATSTPWDGRGAVFATTTVVSASSTDPIQLVVASSTSPTVGPGLVVQASANQVSNLFELQNTAGSFLSGFTTAGGFLMNISSSTAFEVQDGSGNSVLTVDTTATNAGFDVTAASGQTEYLLKVLDNSSVLLSGFSASGGLMVNVASSTALDVQNGSGTQIFGVNTSIAGVNIAGNATTTGWFNVGTTDVVSTLGSTIGAGDLYIGDDATVTGALTLVSLDIDSNNCLYVDAAGNVLGTGSACGAGGGGSAAWEQIFTSPNVLTPTTSLSGGTPTGLFVTASSTIAADFRVDGNSTTTGNLTVDATTLVVQADTNRIGIGTASPQSTVEVNDASNVAELVVQAGSSQATTDLFQLQNNGGTAVFRASDLGNATTTGYLAVGSPTFGSTVAGDANISGTYRTNGADYAEYFYTRDKDLQAGEVVCVDVTKDGAVARCRNVADGNVMGIVSTAPSIVGNNIISEDKGTVIVGMLGQVPARVSSENGPIRPGDSLTSASRPGLVMRASPGDPTVGVALESFALGTALPLVNSSTTPAEVRQGTIRVLISRRNKSLTVEQVEEEVQLRIAELEIQDEIDLLVDASLKAIGVEDTLQQQDTLIDKLTVDISDVQSQLGNSQWQIASLGVAEDIVVNENLLVGGVLQAGEATVADNLVVGQDITALGSLAVGRDAQILGRLISNRLTVNNDTYLLGDLHVDGQTKLAELQAGNMIVNNSFNVFGLAGKLVVEINPASTTTKDVLVVTGNSRFVGDVEIKGQVTASELVLMADEFASEFSAASSTAETLALEPVGSQEVRLKVVASAGEKAQLVVTSGAEFDGTVVVNRAVVNGRLVVTDGLELAGNLELAGALVQTFSEQKGQFLQIGDAVTVVGENVVGLAYADAPEFSPAIGIVVGILEEESATSTPERIIKVAVGGVVKGFESLQAGQRYFLSDIVTYSESQVATATLPSLMLAEPLIDGMAIQVVGLAKSSSELIVNPSFDWRIVGAEGVQSSPIYVNQYSVENITIESTEEKTSPSPAENTVPPTETEAEQSTELEPPEQQETTPIAGTQEGAGDEPSIEESAVDEVLEEENTVQEKETVPVATEEATATVGEVSQAEQEDVES
jgi:hypothetical protein